MGKIDKIKREVATLEDKRVYQNDSPVRSIQEALSLLVPNIEDKANRVIVVDKKEPLMVPYIEVEFYQDEGERYSHSIYYLISFQLVNVLEWSGWVQSFSRDGLKLLRINDAGKKYHALLSLDMSEYDRLRK